MLTLFRETRCRFPDAARPRASGREAGATACQSGGVTARDRGWIQLEGAFNVRDLGGLPVKDGGTTRERVLLRADSLDRLTEADVEVLTGKHGLRHVIDLRSPGERSERHESGPLLSSDVRYSPLQVIPDPQVDGDEEADPRELAERFRAQRYARWQREGDPVEIMVENYLGFLDTGAAAYVTALQRLVEPDGAPGIVHCSAGKDRTGVLVALLLEVAGVERDAVIDDYAATNERMEFVVERLRSADRFQEIAREIPAFVLEARAETMAEFLRRLDDVHGGAAPWFRSQGVDGSTLDTWRSLIVG